MLQQTIGFIGAGQMARALAQGFLKANLVTGSQLVAADVAAGARDEFAKQVPGSRCVESNQHVIDAADVVFLAVKPQHFAAAAGAMSGNSAADPILYVSIAAGIPLAKLNEALRTDRIVRVMPNTPCLVALGASAYCRGAGASVADGELVKQLLEAVGMATELPERLLDAVTGLSGSGPAFVYQFIEALADGGVRVGLPRDVAQQLAVQTVLGAAAMVQQTGDHPAVLKDRVASPGGTTIAGLHALESGGLRAAVINAVQAATERSQELGR